MQEYFLQEYLLTVNSVALHEAGHAVVAAHLRVPFTHATIKPGNGYGGYVRTSHNRLSLYLDKDTGEISSKSDAAMVRVDTRLATNRAIMVLGARAAVELLGLNGNVSESRYSGDEKSVRSLAKGLGISAKDFKSWRNALLLRAREIVRIPFVRLAILRVAAELYREFAVAKRGIPSRKVRELLRSSKTTVEYYSGDKRFEGKHMPMTFDPKFIEVRFSV